VTGPAESVPEGTERECRAPLALNMDNYLAGQTTLFWVFRYSILDYTGGIPPCFGLSGPAKKWMQNADIKSAYGMGRLPWRNKMSEPGCVSMMEGL